MTLNPRPSHQLYDPTLSRQWAEWVETENAEGSRQKEIYPVITKWLTLVYYYTKTFTVGDVYHKARKLRRISRHQVKNKPF